MTGEQRGKGRVDLRLAMLDPAQVFETPEDVGGNESLTRDQKIAILRRWAYDDADVSVAGEEGMPGGAGDLQQRILLALKCLGDGLDPDFERVGPTKQHGLPGGNGSGPEGGLGD